MMNKVILRIKIIALDWHHFLVGVIQTSQNETLYIIVRKAVCFIKVPLGFTEHGQEKKA